VKKRKSNFFFFLTYELFIYGDVRNTNIVICGNVLKIATPLPVSRDAFLLL